jgi:threonine/homoserine/homoserine lactone efflux protein
VIGGISLGIIIQVILQISGLSLLITHSPTAFFILQCLGACYLLYLAYLSFRFASASNYEKKAIELSKIELSNKALLRRGLLMNLSNPKAVLFLLSFLPPAVNTSLSISPSLQIALLGTMFLLSTWVVFGSIAFLAGSLKPFLVNHPKVEVNLQRLSGVVFVILAISLFLT